MKTDRELLELAAKAAGIPIVPCTCRNPRWPFAHDRKASGKYGHWNPLTDDGDALRLAVKLGMDLGVYLDRGGKTYANTRHLLGYGSDGLASWQCHQYFSEEHAADPYAATRRAIVRAAAEIGRAMP